ncbi:MAG: hypothetical protein EB020_09390, partial [Proteobacteria bacterium]|nr:hypothetical protein [Pseudomonadota bacterium]
MRTDFDLPDMQVCASVRSAVRDIGGAAQKGPAPMLHLVIDGFVDDAAVLGQVEPIFDLLNELPGMIEMTKITQPHVFRYHGVVPDDWGVTGMVIIAESHISIHTFP